jgi:uncharacterized membrane protein
MMHDMSEWGGHFGMWLWPIAVAAIIVVVILLVGRSAGREAGGGPEKRKEPLDILKER